MKGRTLSVVALMVMFLLVTMFGSRISPIASEAGAQTKKEGNIEFPTKPIEMVIPWAPGGGTDIVGRMIAQSLEQFLPTKIIVVNKPGAGGALGVQEVVSLSKPDGYTLLFAGNSLVAQTYITKGRVDFNKFVLLGVLNQDFHLVGVGKGAPWATIDEFIKYAKSNPGKIRMAHGGVGSMPHLSVALFQKRAEVKFQEVPFAGANPINMALMGGHIEAGMLLTGETAPLFKSGDLRILAIDSENRLEAYPNIPTFKEKGIDVGVVIWRGVWILKGTPEPVLKIFEEAIEKVGNSQSFKEMLVKAGYIPANILGRTKLEETIKKEDRISVEALKIIGLL